MSTRGSREVRVQLKLTSVVIKIIIFKHNVPTLFKVMSFEFAVLWKIIAPWSASFELPVE